MSNPSATPIEAFDLVERRDYVPLKMTSSPRETLSPVVVDFVPHPFVRGGHLQTLIPFLFPGGRDGATAERRIVPLPDGDALVLHDDQPRHWNAGDPAAVLLHGLAGCHLSPYMVRNARRLNAAGFRVFRMNARAAGDGMTVARFPYNAGRSADVHAALDFISQLCPGSPVVLVGFSLGGVVMLNLAGDLGASAPPHWKGLLAVCPPVDLLSCALGLRRPGNRLYDWYFCRLLRRHVERWWSVNPNAVRRDLTPAPGTLYEFDERFTAPLAGFDSAEHYYRSCSPVRRLENVAVPTTVLASDNDPLAPARDVVEAKVSPAVTRRLESGGHLGFLTRRGTDGRRWLDSFAVAWARSVLENLPSLTPTIR